MKYFRHSLTVLIFLTTLKLGAQNKNNQIVLDWNEAHNTKNISVFKKLYADSVKLYGKNTSKKDCIDKKIVFFEKYPNYNQTIVGSIKISITNDKMKCSFVKKVQLDKTPKNYPSYLIFKKIEGDWKIIVESDSVTDANLMKAKNFSIPKDAVLGDYNGDGKKEYMWLTKPKLKTEDADCVGECNSFIVFSDNAIPRIKVTSCIGGYPVNWGDLNKNGTDEIGLSPEWFSSCWSSYYVWTFLKNKWTFAVSPFSTHCAQWEKGVLPIEIDKQKPGNVVIRYSVLTDDDIVIRKKSLTINR